MVLCRPIRERNPISKGVVWLVSDCLLSIHQACYGLCTFLFYFCTNFTFICYFAIKMYMYMYIFYSISTNFTLFSVCFALKNVYFLFYFILNLPFSFRFAIKNNLTSVVYFCFTFLGFRTPQAPETKGTSVAVG